MKCRRSFIKDGILAATAFAAMPALSSCIRISTIKTQVPMKSRKVHKAAVLWYSQTGNTQKCGKVLAKALKKKGISVTYGDIRDFEPSGMAEVDLETYSVDTDACVLCFGCINNCDQQAVHMAYNGKRVIGLKEFMANNNLQFEIPEEVKE